MPAKKTPAKKAAAAAKRAAKKNAAKTIGRNRLTLDTSDASAALQAALKIERRAARPNLRNAATATDSDATVVQVWQSAATLDDDTISDEVANWAANPTG